MESSVINNSVADEVYWSILGYNHIVDRTLTQGGSDLYGCICYHAGFTQSAALLNTE